MTRYDGLISSKLVHRVYNILDKKKEAESIVFEDPDPETGFIVRQR